MNEPANQPPPPLHHPLAQLALLPGETAEIVADLHNRSLLALIGGDLAGAQRLTAELLACLVNRQEEPAPKTEALLEIVLAATHLQNPA